MELWFILRSHPCQAPNEEAAHTLFSFLSTKSQDSTGMGEREGLVADAYHEATATDPLPGRGPFEHPKSSLRDHIRAARPPAASSDEEVQGQEEGSGNACVLPGPW